MKWSWSVAWWCLCVCVTPQQISRGGGQPLQEIITRVGTSEVILPCGALDEDDRNELNVWIINNGQIFHESTDTFSIPNRATGSLRITRPIKDDEGIYTCVVNDKQSYENRKASRVRLSIISDDPDSELRVYRVDLEASLTRGLIAAGVTAFLVAAICLIYRCRWRPGKNRNVSSYDIAPSQAHLSIIPSEGSLEGFDNIGIRGYDNNGIDISGDHIAQAKTSHIPRYSLEDGPQVSKL